MKAPDFVADFDSATGMVRAIAHGLRAEEFPTLGVDDSPLEYAAGLINKLPETVREQVYIWSGAAEAQPPERMAEVDAEAIARWTVEHYPERTYPAIMIGSSNGAAVHLATALHAPWLPQTFLIPVRRGGIHPDEPLKDLEWGREPGRALLDANPELQLHHMHDPNQDRLMVQQMTYFRVKRRTMGDAYRSFIRSHLEPGGTIVVVECERRWPVITVGERHYFQPGAMGGLEPEEYLHGSERVADYLERYGSHLRAWDFGEPDAEQPEAEWGFEPSLRDEVERFAAEHGYDVRRLVFREPEDLSPLIADLYRWWYVRRGIHPVRLLAESFILLEPYWTLRTGSTPYWAKFSTEPSAQRLEAYLDRAAPFTELNVMLFPHGTEGAGFAGVERWRRIIERVGAGQFIGVDAEAFPRDFAGLKRYHTDLKALGTRHPYPEEALSLPDISTFLAEAGRYGVQWLAGSQATASGSAAREG